MKPKLFPRGPSDSFLEAPPSPQKPGRDGANARDFWGTGLLLLHFLLSKPILKDGFLPIDRRGKARSRWQQSTCHYPWSHPSYHPPGLSKVSVTRSAVRSKPQLEISRHKTLPRVL